MSAQRTARRAAETAGDSRALHALARIGYGASAVVHVLIGYLAIRVALNDPAESDQTGAIAQVAALPGGMVVIWALVVGFFALAVWLVAEAVPGVGSRLRSRWARSAESLAKAVAYAALGVTALTFALGSRSDARTSTQAASSTILQLPGGQVLLGLVGIAAAAVGVGLVVKGVRRGFLEDLDPVGDGLGRRLVVVLGTVGYVAKGIAVAIVGVLFVVAAVKLDPGEASGLDGALRALTALPFGVLLLVVVGIGLILFGGYTFLRARLARM
ncbi:DUF1206 domain-containing protein [Pseudolysinimonas sp.]|uniref:DUF1206 domain-containing protein n=1 Tax=Pseudolysinimonas sp. TaxID=2680009 RepID=UPI003F803EED